MKYITNFINTEKKIHFGIEGFVIYLADDVAVKK